MSKPRRFDPFKAICPICNKEYVECASISCDNCSKYNSRSLKGCNLEYINTKCKCAPMDRRFMMYTTLIQRELEIEGLIEKIQQYDKNYKHYLKMMIENDYE